MSNIIDLKAVKDRKDISSFLEPADKKAFSEVPDEYMGAFGCGECLCMAGQMVKLALKISDPELPEQLRRTIDEARQTLESLERFVTKLEEANKGMATE